MNLKIILKGGMISAISVVLTLSLVYAMKSDFIEAKIGGQLLPTSLPQNESLYSAIGPTENFLQTGIVWDLFDDYTTWPSSESYHSNDTLRMMLWLTSSSSCGYGNKDFVDINGDGLVDLLYSNLCHTIYDNLSKYAVFINNGDHTFNVVYKCVDKYGNPDTYYGDCAAL